jgi:hypothetical protein
MNELEIPIERLNKFFKNHVFEVFINETGDDDSPVTPVNVKIQFTGIKDYVFMGQEKPTLQYTLYILPTNENSDKYYGLLANYFGEEVHIDTRSNQYLAIRWIVDHKLEDMLKYFSLDNRAICTKVVNKIKMPIKEGLITEGKFDPIVRQVVRDIISVFKHNREGEFGLPEDLSGGEMTYNFPKLDTEFSIFLDLQLDPNIEGVDVDADYLSDDDLIYITIVSNPDAKYSILQELTSELNEIVRHELEHIKQNEEGYNFPKEPKNPQKYYTQQHELEAQRAGFKRRAKGDKKDFESVVRQWFEKNKNKHQMNPNQSEKVIQKILKEK